MSRKDLEGRLPVVYNGKAVEEWYQLFCSTAKERNMLRLQLQHAKERIKVLEAKLRGEKSVRDIQGDDCVSI